MNRRPSVAALVVAPTLVALAAPAGAAVPKTPAKYTVPCNDGSGKSAQVWYHSQTPANPYLSEIIKFAAKNPCREWLAIPYGGYYASSAPDSELLVAPAAHFNWGKKQAAQMALSRPMGVFLAGTDTPCNANSPTSVSLVYSYKDVRSPAECP